MRKFSPYHDFILLFYYFLIILWKIYPSLHIYDANMLKRGSIGGMGLKTT